MGRPRRPFGGMETIEPSGDPWMVAVAGRDLGTRGSRRAVTQQGWTYKSLNGYMDPLTYLHILDVVADIEPSIELRAANLVTHLCEVRSQFFWDAVTVGKVLADLCDAFEGVLGDGNGLLERGKDYRGTFYLIHRTRDSARLYHQLRAELAKLGMVAMQAQANGVPLARLASPLLECPVVRGEWKDLDNGRS